jgi:hypothetical protein
MYNPEDAKKSYLFLLQENGLIAGIKSTVFIFSWVFINKFVMDLYTPPYLLFIVFMFFCVYFTWKPKLIRFLRGHLRGEEYRNKAD